MPNENSETTQSRQADIVPATVSEVSVAVIGLGTVGSWLLPLLVKMGVTYIHWQDHDTVETVNTEVQNYHVGQVEMSKAEAALATLQSMGCVPTAGHVVSKQKLVAEQEDDTFDFVISCVDTWAGRRAILEWAVRSQSAWLLDARITGRTSTVLAVNLSDDDQIVAFSEGLGTVKDDRRNAKQRRCGLAGTAYIGAFTAARLTSLINNILLGEEVRPENTYSLSIQREFALT